MYYDRTEIREEIDPIESSKSKECMICHYWLFNHGFEFQDSVCNGCHGLTILCLTISDIAIITVRNVDSCCIIQNIGKYEAINLFKIFCALKSWVYIKKYCLNFEPICKMIDGEYSMDIYKFVK